MPDRKLPVQTLLQGRPWVPSAQTNVQETWRKFGWQPPKFPTNYKKDTHRG